ncbi:MAG: response regulator transcription factor [Cyanobacteria bacterium REEB67]|nr:response regulator transcription factor [Cyanobacteria bacterium REEB67]
MSNVVAKILVVDDEIDLAESIRKWLYQDGHTVKMLHTGSLACEEIAKVTYDVILLDVMLPDVSGVEVCRRYRDAGGEARVLMITAKDQVVDKELALDSGADDYIVKPFDMKEISARVRALMRRSIVLNQTVIAIDAITLDTANKQVFRDGKEIILLPQEFALLEFLMSERNKIFSVETLLKRLWQGKGTAETVRTHIKNLRKKVDKDCTKQFIRTVHGVGYGFTEL